MKRIFLIIGLILINLCCQKAPQSFGARVNPSELKEASSVELKEAMMSMANTIDLLNVALEVDERLTEMKQKEVVARLQQIKLIAESTRKHARAQRHPVFNEHLEMFLKDIDAAVLNAAEKTPRYFLAGRVAGACQYCHGPSPMTPKFKLPSDFGVEFRGIP